MRALDLAQLRGAQYADVRVVNNRTESISVKDGIVEELSSSETEGVGVRVLVNGAWGFASTRNLTNNEIDHITSQAMDIAHASGLVSGEKVDLGPKVASQGKYQTPVKIDPFSVQLEDKLALLLKADADMGKVQGVRTRRANATIIKEQKQFANTEGAFTEQTIFETGGGIQATAVGGSEVQATKQGLYINHFWYTRLVHPRDCVMTGMTRDGVFMIEDGEVAYPVKNLRYTMPYVQVLTNVEAVGKASHLLVSDFGGFSVRGPALKVRGFNFTGSTV